MPFKATEWIPDFMRLCTWLLFPAGNKASGRCVCASQCCLHGCVNLTGLQPGLILWQIKICLETGTAKLPKNNFVKDLSSLWRQCFTWADVFQQVACGLIRLISNCVWDIPLGSSGEKQGVSGGTNHVKGGVFLITPIWLTLATPTAAGLHLDLCCAHVYAACPCASCLLVRRGAASCMQCN